ncbi:hypothetical protein BDF21DRAFT_396215 [Thamnidium elegans]|nr:hypothetical protein BDF21DRAFT_396215 [Thamnidium elegans]
MSIFTKDFKQDKAATAEQTPREFYNPRFIRAFENYPFSFNESLTNSKKYLKEYGFKICSPKEDTRSSLSLWAPTVVPKKRITSPKKIDVHNVFNCCQMRQLRNLVVRFSNANTIFWALRRNT